MGPKSPRGKPRTDPYSRLLYRFYEPLILLRALGQTRGKHTSSPQDASPTESRRRRLLRNLSYLCDYEKGGETTSAIGLEENEQCFVFWVSSNANRSRSKIVQFLESRLTEVPHISMLENEQRNVAETKFIRTCIKFAEHRVKKEKTMLSKAIEKCKRYLDSTRGEDSQLSSWLSQFTSKKAGSVADLCFRVYDQRRAPEMRCLEGKINMNNGESGHDVHSVAFNELHHRLGRLAHHVRAAKEVVDDSTALPHLFDVYRVCPVESVPCNERPQVDSHTELHSILGRMLPANNSRLEEYKEHLTSLDRKLAITERVHQHYEDGNFKPCIHAEIQVLEHFRTKKLRFADNDSYIGCSKPACYCCHLYFRHHESRPVEPESHQKIYLNWGVPALANGAKDPGYIAQRDLMNKMVVAFREEALAQIIRQANPPRWHADSHTDITISTIGLSSAVGDPKIISLEEQLAALDIEPTQAIVIPNTKIPSATIEDLSGSSLEGEVSSSHGFPDEDTLEIDSDSDSDFESGGVSLLSRTSSM
ncbi:hypothetical protein F5Y04DRAFT_252850 [Hypomontagnella monticulosa]|nr:hypothetical protein F5Y04DRAFT_252850 [Hypomontagnella monticulosa]